MCINTVYYIKIPTYKTDILGLYIQELGFLFLICSIQAVARMGLANMLYLHSPTRYSSSTHWKSARFGDYNLLSVDLIRLEAE
jgi:hypothetical protein